MLDVAERGRFHVLDLVQWHTKPTGYFRHLKLAGFEELGVIRWYPNALPRHALLKDERVQGTRCPGMLRHDGGFQVLVCFCCKRARMRVDARGPYAAPEERTPKLLRGQPQCHAFLGQPNDRISRDTVKTKPVNMEHVAGRQHGRLPGRTPVTVDHPASFVAVNLNPIRRQWPHSKCSAAVSSLDLRVSAPPRQSVPDHRFNPRKSAHFRVRLNVK